MGWETFREFHNCYLHTDVLALADVMESYRDSFRAQAGLDPIHYVTLPPPGTPCCGTQPARLPHLITNEQAYKDVRASVTGGLSCIFAQLQPQGLLLRLPVPAGHGLQLPRHGRAGVAKLHFGAFGGLIPGWCSSQRARWTCTACRSGSGGCTEPAGQSERGSSCSS